MDPITWLIIGTIGSVIVQGVTGGLNAKNQRKANEINEANVNWQKEQYQTTLEREDDAVSRRVNDMRNAGLNPMWSGGGAASASSPIAPGQVEKTIDYTGLANALDAISNLPLKTEQLKNLQLQQEFQGWQNMTAEMQYNVLSHDYPFLTNEGRPSWQAKDSFFGLMDMLGIQNSKVQAGTKGSFNFVKWLLEMMF